jgi:hypothetical protein
MDKKKVLKDSEIGFGIIDANAMILSRAPKT